MPVAAHTESVVYNSKESWALLTHVRLLSHAQALCCLWTLENTGDSLSKFLLSSSSLMMVSLATAQRAICVSNGKTITIKTIWNILSTERNLHLAIVRWHSLVQRVITGRKTKKWRGGGKGGGRKERWQFKVYLYRALWELGTEVQNNIWPSRKDSLCLSLHFWQMTGESQDGIYTGQFGQREFSFPVSSFLLTRQRNQISNKCTEHGQGGAGVD